MKRLVLAFAAVLAGSCNCGVDKLVPTPPPPEPPVPTCATDPSLCPPPPPTCETDPSLCPPPPPVELGIVAGRVCAADSHTWLVGAEVFVTGPMGFKVNTVSDMDGRYRLEGVPVGAQTLHIQKGAFSAKKDVVVVKDQVTTLAEDVCELDIAPRVAVVHGSAYDRVEGVLVELGVETEKLDIYQTDWAEQLLATDAGLDGYDILFLNCRSYEGVFMARPDMQTRLRAFVERGGRLHASDQAYDIIVKAFPGLLDFYGNDAVPGAADQGNAVDLTADVVNQSLAQGLGRNTVTIHYGLTTWSAMVSAAPGVEVYVKGDSPMMDGTILHAAPHIVGFAHGDGHVVYSSFHQEPGIGADQENILKLLMFEL